MKDKILNFIKNNKFDFFLIILAFLIVLFSIFTFIFHPEIVSAQDLYDNTISVSVNVPSYDSWSDGIRDKSQAVLGRNG